MKIIINLVKEEKLNIRMPESLVSGFSPNTIYYVGNFLDYNNRLCTKVIEITNEQAQTLL